jgi:hypothetical protein
MLLVAPGWRPITEFVGAVTLVTAGAVVTPVLVKKPGVDVDVTLAKVGVTAVTTWSPCTPLTAFMTGTKVGVTLVTHVAADAEDTSAVLRLPTVSAAKSVWFEADANSASRTPARRATILCLVITRPHESTLVLYYARNCLADL